MRLNTYHNLYFYLDFFRKMRKAIEENTFEGFKAQWEPLFDITDAEGAAE
jgi:queuine tRNA-ribosyltransferase